MSALRDFGIRRKGVAQHIGLLLCFLLPLRRKRREKDESAPAYACVCMCVFCVVAIQRKKALGPDKCATPARVCCCNQKKRSARARQACRPLICASPLRIVRALFFLRLSRTEETRTPCRLSRSEKKTRTGKEGRSKAPRGQRWKDHERDTIAPKDADKKKRATVRAHVRAAVLAHPRTT